MEEVVVPAEIVDVAITGEEEGSTGEEGSMRAADSMTETTTTTGDSSTRDHPAT